MCIRTSNYLLPDYVEDPSHKFFTRTFLTKSTIEFNQGNYLSCPLGVMFLLSVIFGSGGARGRTAQQIGRTLNLKSSVELENFLDATNEGTSLYREIHGSLTNEFTMLKDTRVPVISIGTAAFIQSGYPVLPKWSQSMRDDFKAHYQTLDFRNRTEAAGQINSWVNGETRGLIPQFFKNPNDVPSDTRAALINVLYFKDAWDRPFNRFEVTTEDFTVTSNRTIPIPMMSSVEVLKFGEYSDAGFRMISKPLRNPRYSLVVVLPIEKWDLTGAELLLSGRERLADYMAELEERTISLKLPKFKLESKMDLIRTLESMGVVDLFRQNQANLSGITTREGLYVELMQQSSVLKINEDGVEAAAATAALIQPMSLLIAETNFYVTHPFVCFIYDNYLHMPLFAARVIEPSPTD